MKSEAEHHAVLMKYDKLLDDHIQLLKDYTALLKEDIVRVKGEELLETLEVERDGDEWKGYGDAS